MGHWQKKVLEKLGVRSFRNCVMASLDEDSNEEDEDEEEEDDDDDQDSEILAFIDDPTGSEASTNEDDLI
ncbi:hypothetical protein G7Z17_g11842 [Cylindrodendrum hubeiense]|uniref:Uncharacterized protein n=1 Tax=Cylindrodendrum hubeiense TaxID=595255 RepID=A0A9P5LB82_9HYPO|nr:hypothetical protein G7Z17_g11842 [Cylindrodendrum hubeiense]